MADGEAEADEEEAETGAALVGEVPSVPVVEPTEDLAEVTDVAGTAVVLDTQTTASGTVTPAVVQICLAYRTAAAWSDALQAAARQQATLLRKLELLQMHLMSRFPHEAI